MMTREDFARGELEKELRNKLDTFIRLAEVSRRAIELEQQNMANYSAQIKVLRESLRNLKSPHVREVRTVTTQEPPQNAPADSLLNLLEKLKFGRRREA